MKVEVGLEIEASLVDVGSWLTVVEAALTEGGGIVVSWLCGALGALFPGSGVTSVTARAVSNVSMNVLYSKSVYSGVMKLR
jgi:hypothetical protein